MTNPAVPGTPMRLRPAITRPNAVSGMRRPSPARLPTLIDAAPLRSATPPSSRKIAPLVTPWLSRWAIEPVRPAWFSSPMPSVM
ncbi:MAG: hypothetical protein U1F45_17685 [Burkholderiales bacterium]